MPLFNIGFFFLSLVFRYTYKRASPETTHQKKERRNGHSQCPQVLGEENCDKDKSLCILKKKKVKMRMSHERSRRINDMKKKKGSHNLLIL